MLLTPYDPATADLLYGVYDAVWPKVQPAPPGSLAENAYAIARLTTQILAAAGTGERDPARLRLLALEGFAVG